MTSSSNFCPSGDSCKGRVENRLAHTFSVILSSAQPKDINQNEWEKKQHPMGQSQQPQQLPTSWLVQPCPLISQLLSFFPISHQETCSCHHSTLCLVYFYFVLNTLIYHLIFLPVVSPSPSKLCMVLGAVAPKFADTWQTGTELASALTGSPCSSGWHMLRKEQICPRHRDQQQVNFIVSQGTHASLV